MSNIPWLDYLIKLQNEGFKEIPGSESNPKILEWAKNAAHYPYMTDDSTTPWCGIGLAGVFSDIGMSKEIPDSPALAISWLNFGVPCTPKVGAIAIFPRVGGNHVTCIREIRGEDWLCIGCNQSDAITTTRFSASGAKGTRWPKGVAMTVEPVVTSRYKELLERKQIKPEWQTTIDSIANRIIAKRDIYKEVEKATGVPWAFIGAIHYRESDLDFKTHLHNGDPLSGRTTHVPAGRPREGEPPFKWSDSAIDALAYEGFTGKTDWTLENICERGERYNGLGYRNIGKPSPYLWSGTNNYEMGKYIADGKYDASTVDKQAGIIPVYLRTMDLAKETTIRESSRKLYFISWVKTGVQSLVATIGGLFTLDTWGVVKDWFTLTNGVLTGKLLIAVALMAIIMWVIVHWLDSMIMQDAKSGNYVPSGMVEPEKELVPEVSITPGQEAPDDTIVVSVST